MVKKSKKEAYINLKPHLDKIKQHEEGEERAFYRLAHAMGYRLPGGEPRRRHEVKEK
jgi:hypothetical protein